MTRRRLIAAGACLSLLLLAAAVWSNRDVPALTDASGSADRVGRQSAPSAEDGADGPMQGQQAPDDQERSPSATSSIGDAQAAPPIGSNNTAAQGAGPAPAGSGTPGTSPGTSPDNGAPAYLAVGPEGGSRARGFDSAAPPPTSARQLPVYSAGDFYHWRWSPQSRSALPWAFTSSVPLPWREPISTAARSWNAERRSLQYAAPGGDLSAYPPHGCAKEQLKMNGVHRASLDGPDGIVATTYSCVDVTTAEAVSVQVLIDADERWFTTNTAPTAGKYDLVGAVAHEFGHATGWEGHYAIDDRRCAEGAHVERMCPRLAPNSTAWRTTGSTDRAIFGAAY